MTKYFVIVKELKRNKYWAFVEAGDDKESASYYNSIAVFNGRAEAERVAQKYNDENTLWWIRHNKNWKREKTKRELEIDKEIEDIQTHVKILLWERRKMEEEMETGTDYVKSLSNLLSINDKIKECGNRVEELNKTKEYMIIKQAEREIWGGLIC